jgi:hypothetical protein
MTYTRMLELFVNGFLGAGSGSPLVFSSRKFCN